MERERICRRILCLLTLLLALAMVFACSVNVFAEEPVVVEDKNNLATNKWDWATDKVGTGSATIDDNGIKLENFNTGNAIYAIYQTNRMEEFRFSMHANLHLTQPSEKGVPAGSYQHDYSNLYISFMIDADTPSPVYCCPWSGDKANFSVCFENLQGSPKTQLYLNECFAGSGATRKVVASSDEVQWNDGEYHWFEFEVRKAEQDGETGILFRFFFDGKEVPSLKYFQKDKNVYSNYLGGYVEDAGFSKKGGYVGFWPGSDFPVGWETAKSDCYVQVDQVQITSFDNGNTEPFERAPKPKFEITSINFSPEANYETGIEIEVKLADLFEYEGDDELQYSIQSGGKDIGSIRNGYWVWTPEKAGNYDVDFHATNEDGATAVNYVTFRVTGDSSEGTPSKDNEGGCSGSVTSAAGIAAAVTVLLAAGICVSVMRLKRER